MQAVQVEFEVELVELELVQVLQLVGQLEHTDVPPSENCPGIHAVQVLFAKP